MNTILALLCVYTFALAVVLLFLDQTKSINAVSIKVKKLNDLETKKKEAEARADYSTARTLKKEIDQLTLKSAGGCAVIFTGCFFSLLGQIQLLVLEMVVMIWALTAGIGNPLFGYIALFVWVAILLFAFFVTPKIVAQQKKQAEEAGNIYLVKPTNIFVKAIGFVPDLYILYVVLVIIGLFTIAL